MAVHDHDDDLLPTVAVLREQRCSFRFSECGANQLMEHVDVVGEWG
jgi:hypothetical protein